jgi:integrase
MPRSSEPFSVFRRGKVWWCRFRLVPGGRQLFESIGTNGSETEAKRVATQIYADAKRAAASGDGLPSVTAQRAQAAAQKARTLTLDEACGTYWKDRGEWVKTSDDIKRYTDTLLRELGKTTLLTDLTLRKLLDYVARRRMRKTADGRDCYRAPGSINRELGHLRTVLIHARDSGFEVPHFKWKEKLFLDEPENYQHPLNEEQEARLFAVLRHDLHDMFEFAIATGLRLDNIITLRWDQVDWTTRLVTVRAKSKKPGGRLHRVDITVRVAAILRRCEGQHPEFVFTFVCQRNRHDPHAGLMQERDKRYPFTTSGWRREFDRARIEAGVEKTRFHDLRHTFATRLHKASGKLALVQKALAHADVATTMRYISVEQDDVRAAMEAADKMFAPLLKLVESG